MGERLGLLHGFCNLFIERLHREREREMESQTKSREREKCNDMRIVFGAEHL